MSFSLVAMIQNCKLILIAFPLDNLYYRLASKGDYQMGSWLMCKEMISAMHEVCSPFLRTAVFFPFKKNTVCFFSNADICPLFTCCILTQTCVKCSMRCAAFPVGWQFLFWWWMWWLIPSQDIAIKTDAGLNECKVADWLTRFRTMDV